MSKRERRMIPLLIEAAQEMDTIFWQQVYPASDSLLAAVRDSATREYILRSTTALGTGSTTTRPFVPGVGPHPKAPRSIPPI